MSVSAPFIARPVATWLLAFAVLLTGLFGYRMLPVAALPQVDFPTIQVTTQLPGASTETVAAILTAPLERQFGQIPGLTSMISTSSEGTSAITLQFDLAENIDVAAEDVQAAINAAQGVLPQGLPYPPTYSKVNPADQPIMTLALTSDQIPLIDLDDVADTLLAQKLSQLSGVGRVLVEGGQRPSVRVRMDPAKLAAYGITMDDIRTALTNANVNLSKGSFDGAKQAFAIDANDQIVNPQDYANLIIGSSANGAALRIRDVGVVVRDAENVRSGGWVNGKAAVIVDIQRQPDANIVATADRIKAALPALEAGIPAGVKVSILADRTTTIRASVKDVQFTLILTIILVILVIWLFLRSVRATIIPGLALPLSLIATFGIMSLCGFSLDNLSLMALTIASGFVVDDAIVMIENIVRYIEAGEPPLAAAFKGAAEIGFTVISLTVSLVAVFIPLLFMTGIVGRLFREFALTLTIAVVTSAVISLTLTPMMCGRMLKAGTLRHTDDNNRHNRGFFAGMLHFYRRTLAWALMRQRLVLWIALATFAVTALLYVWTDKGFLPLEDTGILTVTTDAHQTVSFREMTRLQAEVARVIGEDPDVTGVASFLGVGTINATLNTGHITVVLKPQAQRSETAFEVIDRLTAKLAQIPGITAHMQATQDIQIGARASRTQYQYTLTDLDPVELSKYAAQLLARLQKEPALTDVASDIQDNGAAVIITINRDNALRLGVNTSLVDNLLYDSFGQRQVSTIYAQANQYRVVLETNPAFQMDPANLASLYVKSTAGKMVPLAAIAKIARGSAPLALQHQGQFPAVTLSFNLTNGASLSEAVRVIDRDREALGMPNTIVTGYSGDAAEFQSSLANEPMLILAAIVVIYIVLGVLYESTIHPITILSTLPSAGIGALLALHFTGQDLSIVALIGILLLMGIVKKNAIMMIDFALAAERNEGMPPRAAIYKACLLRFRPIMMTTMAALLGAIPLAVDQGTGSELRRPLGIAIVGGLLLSQVLTLYTTPVIYLALDRLRRRWIHVTPAQPETMAEP